MIGIRIGPRITLRDRPRSMWTFRSSMAKAPTTKVRGVRYRLRWLIEMMVLSTRASSPLRMATIIRSNWARMPVRGGVVDRDSVPGDAGAAPVAAGPGSGLPTGPGGSAPSVIGNTLPVVPADEHGVRAPAPVPPPATLDPMAAQYIYTCLLYTSPSPRDRTR